MIFSKDFNGLFGITIEGSGQRWLSLKHLADLNAQIASELLEFNTDANTIREANRQGSLWIHIEKQEVYAFEPIFGEFLQGVRNLREKEMIEQYWKFLPRVNLEEEMIKAGVLSIIPSEIVFIPKDS